MLHNSIASLFVWNYYSCKILSWIIGEKCSCFCHNQQSSNIQDYQEARPLSWKKKSSSSSHSFISPALLLQWFVWQHHSRHHLHLPGSAQPHLHPSGGRVPAGPAPFPHSQGNSGHVVYWPGHVHFSSVRYLFLDLAMFVVSQCILRVHFVEAQDLVGKDKFLGGLIKGKSDPYGVLRLGTELFQSKVIHETVNPKWNEVYEVGLQQVLPI